MKDSAIKYAKLACETMMKKFAPEDLPPKGGFHYHQGVFLSGMMHLYDVCGDERYFDYIKSWVDSIIVEDGIIRRFFKGALDDYMAGILLFPLYEKTKEKKYLSALDLFAMILRNWVCNKKGGFWHKEEYPEQMWLDGLYMASPLLATYGTAFNKPEFFEEPVKQAVLMYENMQKRETKLLYHAWNCPMEAPPAKWGDPDTGCSPEIWGRAMGWYVVAVLDILEQLPKNHPQYARLCDIEGELLAALVEFQDSKSGMWYQVVDKGNEPGNWVETSCSCLYVYALSKAMRMGVIKDDFKESVTRGFYGIINHSVNVEDGALNLSGVCVGTGVCDYEGYIARPTSTNDLHGMGAFLLMCAEIAK